MRAVFLIALREFAENAKTKGFWIGLLLFPLMIYGSIFAQKFLNDSTPTRNYILVDQSGEYGDVVREAMQREHDEDVLMALIEYQTKYAKVVPGADVGSMPSADDLENSSPEKMQAMAAKAMAAMGDMLAPMLKDDGLDQVLAFMSKDLIEDRPAFEEPKREFLEIPLPEGIELDADFAELSEQLRPYLLGKGVQVDGESKELFAAVLIPKDVASTVEGQFDMAAMVKAAGTPPIGEAGQAQGRSDTQYWAGNLADEDLRRSISRAMHAELRKNAFAERELDAEKVAAVQAMEIPFTSLNPNKAVGKEEVSTADKVRQWAPVGFVYLLWIGIFTISQMLLNNTIEEKSNRIIEVLLSSVTAGELMMGKLAGIAAVGLTMIGVWMGSLVVILKMNSGPESKMASVLWEVLQTSGLIPIFMLYFILGYLLYSAIFLSIGSMCNTLKEAQNLMGPVMLIMMVPMVTMMFIPKDPNGTLARVLSWIPLYTPFTMMNRAAANPPMVDWIGTGILLLASTALAMFFAGRVFRAGILRTGQPPKLKEFFGWLKAS